MIGRLVVGAAMAALLAFAQPPGGGGGGEEMGGGGGGRGGGRGGMDMAPNIGPRRVLSKPEQIIEKLKLNKDQKDEFEKIMNSGREEAKPVQEAMIKLRGQLASAMVQGAADADMKKAMDNYAAAAAQMTAIEAKAYGKLYAILKPNQQSKGPQAFELMAGLFEQRIMVGRGDGRSPGPGR